MTESARSPSSNAPMGASRALIHERDCSDRRPSNTELDCSDGDESRDDTDSEHDNSDPRASKWEVEGDREVTMHQDGASCTILGVAGVAGGRLFYNCTNTQIVL